MPDTSDQKVSQGLNLHMTLERPGDLVALMTAIAKAKPTIDKALSSLHYVHFARFLPVPEAGALQVITEFDGAPMRVDPATGRVLDDDGLRAYVMDFAAVLKAEFSMILGYMKDKPRLPVERFPDDFWRYVQANNRWKFQPFSAYPDKTVIDILGAAGAVASASPPPPAAATPVDRDDVQANLLRGIRARFAQHLMLKVTPGCDVHGLLAELSSDTPSDAGLRISSDADWQDGQAPAYWLTLGLTHAGLRELGLGPNKLAAFPAAFREGPALRAELNGDTGPADPKAWRVGGPGTKPVHLMLSLYTRAESELRDRSQTLRALVQRHGLDLAYSQDARELPGQREHFGFRDGSSQPLIAGMSKAGAPADTLALAAASAAPAASAFREPEAPVGDFLLGGGHLNNAGGNAQGDLPARLADNGSYAVFRLIDQDVALFESFLQASAEAKGLDAELIAAKMVGRWRDGRPLMPGPDGTALPAEDPPRNDFDYVGAAIAKPDPDGAVCPFGSHIRRSHPRSGPLMGRPFAHRLIRRGLPYSEQVSNGPERKGLAGLFYCADIASQFEFVQRHYIQGELGVGDARGLRDPLLGQHRPEARHFRFRAAADAPNEVTLTLPDKPFTTTAGSLYLFVPGLRALRWLADRAPAEPGKALGYRESGRAAASSGARSVAARGSSAGSAAPRITPISFNPDDVALLADPYPVFRAFRESAPVSFVGSHQRWWVFSHDLVKTVCAEDNERIFLKPGNALSTKQGAFSSERALPDGLFFMNQDEHRKARRFMEPALAAESARWDGWARASAEAALQRVAGGAGFDLVAGFSSVVPREVFMQVMGLPEDPTGAFAGWINAMLNARSLAAKPEAKLQGATGGMAVRAYFQALGLACPARGASPSVPADPMQPRRDGLFARLQDTSSGQRPSALQIQESALHFALGGYLSTEFLITTGVLNLLRHPDQLAWLCEDIEGRIDGAVAEMLRFDAPFQLADRVVGQDTELGGVTLKKDARLAVVYGSANHDDAAVGGSGDAECFDIRRDPRLGERFGFGHGHHECIGKHLATTVAKAALTQLLTRYPEMRLGELGAWRPDPYFRSPTRLLVLTG